MKSVTYIRIFLVSIFALQSIGLVPWGRMATAQNSNSETAGSEKIYRASEVDRRPKIKKKPQPSLGSDCVADTGMASFKVVLHKSAQITLVKMLKSSGCNFDQQAVDAIGKIRFEPAMKDGQPVSVYAILEYTYDRGR